MKTLTIYGESDDLIEVDGDIHEEFNPHEDGEPMYLAFSDGTVLSILYGDDGNWKIKRLTIGTASYQHQPADGDEYTDRATLKGDIAWCVCGKSFAKPA